MTSSMTKVKKKTMTVLTISTNNKSHKNFLTLILKVKKIKSNRHLESEEDKLETEGLLE